MIRLGVIGLLAGFLLTGYSVDRANYKPRIRAWQQEQIDHWINPETSPLHSSEEIAEFEGVHFFPIRRKYCFQARFSRAESTDTLEMPTSAGKIKYYEEYGYADFIFRGERHRLTIYQSLKLREMEEYKDYLFAPFTDHTSGDKSYGGGRYLDLRIPEGDIIEIDFNKAYNPYCAYTTGYNCPIPPDANRLDFAVKAGVRAPHDH